MFEYISVSQIKIIKRAEKRKVDLNIELERTVLSTISTSRVDYGTT